MNHVRPALATAAAAILMLTACGDDSAEPESPTTESSPSPTSATSAPTTDESTTTEQSTATNEPTSEGSATSAVDAGSTAYGEPLAGEVAAPGTEVEVGDTVTTHVQALEEGD